MTNAGKLSIMKLLECLLETAMRKCKKVNQKALNKMI